MYTYISNSSIHTYQTQKENDTVSKPLTSLSNLDAVGMLLEPGLGGMDGFVWTGRWDGGRNGCWDRVDAGGRLSV